MGKHLAGTEEVSISALHRYSSASCGCATTYLIITVVVKFSYSAGAPQS
jgi:hypothetical protein